MKKTNTFTNIAMFVLFAAMLVYLGVYLFRSTQQSYATAPAVLVTVSESGQASGIVVREEQVIASDKEFLSLSVDDGKEVASGGEIAIGVDSKAALDSASRARELKKEIRQEAKQAKKEIKERKNRFKEGVESIRDDLTDESQYHDYRTSGTAPMSSEGYYRARDAYGTVNNYEERILDHADRTAERMQQDVNDAAERIRKKVDRL